MADSGNIEASVAEQHIVIDDVDVVESAGAGPSTSLAAPASTGPGTRRTARVRIPAERAILAASSAQIENGGERNTTAEARAASSRLRPRFQAKLKLRLSDKAAAMAPGMSFLGPYDRELDSDDEELVFEEQILLRLSEGEDADKLRKMVSSREVSSDVWFKFKDSRRAIFHMGNDSYAAKLVDLPCIIESQKTLDNKAMFKVADICQMLVVDSKIDTEDQITLNKKLNLEEYIWPHGMTPPLNHVRKRRFRKRINKRTIESVEEEVERLLGEDALATEVKYDILENVNPDLSDSEFIERDEDDMYDVPTPLLGGFTAEKSRHIDDGDENSDSDSDSDSTSEESGDEEGLAAELDLALGDANEPSQGGKGEDDEDDEDDDDDDDSSSSEDSEDSADETVQNIRLLNEEISDLQAAVRRKNAEISSSGNPLIRRRFEDALKKLTVDLDLKLSQRDNLQQLQRKRKEGIHDESGVTPADDLFGDSAEENEDEGDDNMDIS